MRYWTTGYTQEVNTAIQYMLLVLHSCTFDLLTYTRINSPIFINAFTRTHVHTCIQGRNVFGLRCWGSDIFSIWRLLVACRRPLHLTVYDKLPSYKEIVITDIKTSVNTSYYIQISSSSSPSFPSCIRSSICYGSPLLPRSAPCSFTSRCVVQRCLETRSLIILKRWFFPLSSLGVYLDHNLTHIQSFPNVVVFNAIQSWHTLQAPKKHTFLPTEYDKAFWAPMFHNYTKDYIMLFS